MLPQYAAAKLSAGRRYHDEHETELPFPTELNGRFPQVNKAGGSRVFRDASGRSYHIHLVRPDKSIALVVPRGLFATFAPEHS